MRLRRELRNPRAVAPIVAVLLAVIWASCAGAVPCPEMIFFRVGDQSAVMGWTMGVDEHEVEDFGGYRLWMREVWMDPDVSAEEPWLSFSLIREYVLDEDDPYAAGYWTFPAFWDEDPVCVEWVGAECDSFVGGVRRDSTAVFSNAFPYEFVVTTFSASDPRANNAECFDPSRTTGVVYPRVGTRDDLSNVRCIPNPYRASADWEYGGQRRVAFIGLPERATIRIYTIAADLVVTLEHGDKPEDIDSDIEFWDLKNEDDDEVAPGVYMFHVESDGMGSMEGKVMIIK